MTTTFRHTLRIVAVGDELGFELPQDIIDRHHLREGDDVYFSWTANGLHLTFAPPISEPAQRDRGPRDSS